MRTAFRIFIDLEPYNYRSKKNIRNHIILPPHLHMIISTLTLITPTIILSSQLIYELLEERVCGFYLNICA